MFTVTPRKLQSSIGLRANES